MKCWIVEQDLAARGSCSGQLVKAHLIPKQRIKREFPRGAVKAGGENVWRPLRRGEQLGARMFLPLEAIVWSHRVVVPICGGPMGNAGHHGQLDAAGVNRLVIAREKLPAALEQFAQEFGLEWSLEADYGPRRG